MCDVVYVLMLQQIERWAMVNHLTAVTLAAAGAKVDIPDPDASRHEFDRWLTLPLETASEPGRAGGRQEKIAAALGLN